MTEPLDRNALYELVWSKPMTAVAEEYGLSDRGLAKLCERNGIPVPPRGYWAKKQAGKKVVKPTLIILDNGKPETAILLEKTKVETSPAVFRPVDEYPEPIQKAIDREKLSENKIAVPATLANPHPIVTRWIRDNKTMQESSRSLGVHVDKTTDLDNRRYRIFSALLKALEQRGFKVEVDRYYTRSVKVSLERDELFLDVDERIKQFRCELTPEEKREHWNQNQRWTQVREPTGKLRVRLLWNEKTNTLQEFAEIDEAPLEERLNHAVIGIIQEIWKKKKYRLEREEEERQRYLQSQEVARINELRKKEASRRDELEAKASNWQKAASIRSYVTAVEDAFDIGTLKASLEEFEEWKVWALSHADEIDPIKKGIPMTELPSDDKQTNLTQL